MTKVKITKRLTPELVNRRVKRVGKPYWEVSYWNGRGWSYKEFTTSVLAREFASKFKEQ